MISFIVYTIFTLLCPVENNMHDWECRYIIHDFYGEAAEEHYVDDYVINVDGSISFIDIDGLITNIPYPYFSIEENEKR